jgi:hypothetical protein
MAFNPIISLIGNKTVINDSNTMGVNGIFFDHLHSNGIANNIIADIWNNAPIIITT